MVTGSASSRVATSPVAPEAPGRRGPALDVLIVVAAAALGLAHALVLASRYHVGSFDDDASYLMTARALAAGTGLGGILPAGIPLVATYPPGFALLLAPVALVAGDATWPYRALVLACFVALFPLTDLWLRRTRASRRLRAGVLLLLALSPVAGTFATMVMAEAPFLVVLLGLLLLAPRWAAAPRALCAAGVGTVLLAAALLWLKQAGLGLVVGLALWLVLRRRWGRAAALVAAVAASFAPILALRAAAGTPLAGARYSSEIGVGGLGAVPGALRDYALTALPDTIVPIGSLPAGVFVAVYYSVPVLVAVGVLLWLRRRDDAATVITLVYLAETLVYPYINERRTVLVLPVILAWYLTGAGALVRVVDRAVARRLPRLRPAGWVAALGALLLVVALALQFDRNYLLGPGQQTSRPLGSAYLAFLDAVTGPGDVVESRYVWAASLATGRRTTNGMFADAGCTSEAMRRAAAVDGAGFVVDARWNSPHDIECSRAVLDDARWAVALYRTAADDGVVYELVGPGTAHPQLTDTPLGAATSASAAGTSTLTWEWPAPRRLAQLSVGTAGAATGTATRVQLEWRGADGAWHTAAGSGGEVGPGERTRFLVWQPGHPVAATGVRIAVTGGTGVTADQVHALTVAGS